MSAQCLENYNRKGTGGPAKRRRPRCMEFVVTSYMIS